MPAANGETKQPLRIVVGSDNAGHTMKTALKETLSKNPGVAEVLDVGVVDADDTKAYPHLAVEACKKIKSGEVCPAHPLLVQLADVDRLIGHCSSVVLVWV